jgi:hypothetical protein
MKIGAPSAAVRALALALVPLLSTIPAQAEPLPRIDVAAYCRAIQAINLLPGNAEQKYAGCLENEHQYLQHLELHWASLNKKQQRQCLRENTSNPLYFGLSVCVSEILRQRAIAKLYEDKRPRH